MSRRLFIGGLVALGVSTGAAVTYADVLSAKTLTPATSADSPADIYPDDTSTTSTTSTTTDSGVSAGQAGRNGPATPVQTDPTFTG
jgi:hypothetical protein